MVCAWRVAEAAPAHTGERCPWQGHPLTRGREGTLRGCRAVGGNQPPLAVGEARNKTAEREATQKMGRSQWETR